MSTNAESALRWLDEQQPDTQQIQEVIQKLEARLNSGASQEQLSGTVEALELLQEVLEERELQQPDTHAAVPATPDTITEQNAAKLDLSPLGEPASIPEEHLSDTDKRKRFEQLKQQLSK
ncbi:hypothetical protein [Gynuella sunshinyii]|uniref:Uncharacterized protein n=1 Tax=Gynuella sunshinyii YC6258 TaxID=1445510 RepID=A0A0C5VRK5_9GAMM|nr:hypothetical protein [Gynuella sunshinyii]AJQ96871.1 hypothetical Protein YC6258_04839 [Gynuella sunshinyii YC6258]